MLSHENKDPCEVCATEQATTFSTGGYDGIHQNCPRCGEFRLAGTACAMMSHGIGIDKRALLSGWVRNQNRLGSVPTITSVNIKAILAAPLPPVVERSDALLKEAVLGLKGLGDSFDISEPRFLAATYSATKQDVYYLLNILREQGFATQVTTAGSCQILPKGYVRLDEWRSKGASSSRGFIAMSFHTDLNVAYSDGFQVGVLGAGYEPVRVDQVEHINRIDDEIINQINQAKFVVADFTGHRGGVYFEAGYALGRGLPVFWTCKKSDMPELHFDIRQFNCIGWDSPEELAERLRVRIEAVLGRGPRLNNF